MINIGNSKKFVGLCHDTSIFSTIPSTGTPREFLLLATILNERTTSTQIYDSGFFDEVSPPRYLGITDTSFTQGLLRLDQKSSRRDSI